MAENNFADALAAWKEINLGELQKTLDAQGVELVENQKESVVGRKVLADKTREFKRLPDGEKLSDIKALLKAYQAEIDSLTRRTKSAETAFLSVYKILAEAPDPFPLLDAAIDQMVKVGESKELEAEIEKLKSENAELQRKLADTAGQEMAKKRAEEKLEALESRMEDAIRDKVAQKESELHATYDERILNYEERERDLQRQVTLLKGQLRDLRSSNDSNQAKLLDQTQRQDSEVMAKLAEMDILVSDLERANSRVAAVERRNELLRAEIEAVRTGQETEEKTRTLESRISELEAETAGLMRTLESQKMTYEANDNSTKRRLADVTKDLTQKASEVESLRNRLKQYSDYDEIKRELEIMKYVEFAGAEDDQDMQLPDPNASKANQQQAKSLETLLATKNRKMLEELTRFRVLHGELEESFRSVSEELATCRAELEKQKILTERLENDLMHVDRHMGQANGERPSGRSTPSAAPDGLSGLNLGSNSDKSVRYTPIPFSSAADTSILPIVTSQRDRFRQRNAELEEELKKQFDTISELRTDIKSLQNDNLKLYEKIRYMQSYRDEGSTAAGPSASTGASYTRAQNNTPRNDGLGKYRSLYEQNMNPFEAFRGREAARAVQALNPLERGVLILTQAILGNRRTRLFFIVYAMALHALILFTSYECTSVGSRQPTSRMPR
ncbi:hypothetical protein FRC14_007407 [Serendipita sp. 396]|nr:hypothetical protein FRC14_007407 [Serendipita sp. 396]KAG8772211.1 hypothetical protein FRC15_002896 [Serendipita sp. 397]KAG8844750.1 hypothetical protein FRC20_003401 [Serendipita sp. 405]